MLKDTIFSRAPDHNGRYQGFPAPDGRIFDLATRIPRHLYHPVDISTHSRSLLPTSETSFSASAICFRFLFLPLSASSPRRDFALQGFCFRPARRPFHGSAFGIAFILLVQISTHLRISPSAFNAVAAVSQPAADRFPIPSLPSDIPDVR